jgi:hypothetical protein
LAFISYSLNSSTVLSQVWETRTDPAVLDAFTKVFGTNELITSFDGASVMLPGQKAADLGRWPHIGAHKSHLLFYTPRLILFFLSQTKTLSVKVSSAFKAS